MHNAIVMPVKKPEKRRKLRKLKQDKGSTDEGFNILIALFILVIMVGFVFYLLAASTEKYEEQTFLDSVAELSTTMEYMCANPGTETMTVEVKMPQKVGDPASWIAGWGDPKYLVYYEKFPVGEEWAWTTWVIKNPWANIGETVLLGVALNSIPGLKALGRGGVVVDEAIDVAGGSTSKAADLVASGAIPTVEEITMGARVKRALLMGMLKLKDRAKKIMFGLAIEDIASDEFDLAEKQLVNIDVYSTAVEAEITNVDDAELIWRWADPQTSLNVDNSLDELIKLANTKGYTTLGEKLTTYKDALNQNPIAAKALVKLNSMAFFKNARRSIILISTATIGTWVGNDYIFSKTLDPLDRANEKFISCGVNALCAKTPNYIAVFPLSQCALHNIRYVRLQKGGENIFDTGGDKPVQTPADIVKFITNIFVSNQKRFYLASPCGTTFEIKRYDENDPNVCMCLDTDEEVSELKYTQYDDGKWGFETVPKGTSKICDEIPTDYIEKQEYNKHLVKTPCLVVKSTGKAVEGYGGSDDPYSNFCYSSSEKAMEVSKFSILGSSTVVDIGLMFLAPETAGLSITAIGIANSVATDLGMASVADRFLWPNG